MSLKKHELDALIIELSVLQGSQVQKITQPSTDEIVLQFRQPGENLPLLLSVAPGQPRLHLVAQRPPSLPTPPQFCMLLRKYLSNARLLQVGVLPHDRVVLFQLRRAEETNFLILELLPRQSNLLLCDGDGRLRHSLRPVSPQRGLRRGDPYAAPPRFEQRPRSQFSAHDLTLFPLALTCIEETEHPCAGFAYPQTPTSPIDHIPAASVQQEIEQTLQDEITALDSRKRWLSCRTHRFLDTRYLAKSHATRLQQARQLAQKDRRKQSKRLQRLVKNLERDLASCHRTLKREHDAELLKPMIHQIKRGQTQVEVTDYYDPAMKKRKIKLDPELSPQQNLQRLFQRIKRARKGLDSIQPRLEQAQDQLDTLELELLEIQEAEDLEALAPYLNNITPTLQKQRRQSQQQSVPYHSIQGHGGHTIWVGKNSKANDTLSFRVARGNDLWLHAKGYAGSHVVVRLPKGQPVQTQLLVDAALLAIHFSKARQQTHAEVMHTQAKYVKKPKSASPGQVSVIRADYLTLRVDRERIATLLAKPEKST